MRTEKHLSTNNITIPEGFVALIQSSDSRRSYRAGSLIYAEGDPADHFYYLEKGQVRIFVSSEQGSEKTLTVYREHNFFGEAAFFDGYPRMSSARAASDCQVAVISREDILTWFRQDPDLALSMIASLSQTIRMLSGQINQISFLGADRRLARFLLDETTAADALVTFTHEEIGALIGTSRVTVSRLLQEFKKNAWIKTGYGSIQVINRTGLQEFCDY